MPPSRPYVTYSIARLETWAARIQLNPVISTPNESSSLGPKRSTSTPCHGERNVCTTIRIENVICSSGSVERSPEVSGCVNSAQTYCGLEITIIQMTPSSN